MNNPFVCLGETVAAHYKNEHYNERVFSDIAYQALAEFKLPPQPEPSQLFDWIFGDNTPTQTFDDKFSDLPLVVYQTPQFMIQVLHWMHSTTAIHQHAFSGAFRVWKGSSIHSQYRFDESRFINARLRLGTAPPQTIELLDQGDTRTIHSGNAMTHSLFHLESPSITIVVRTYTDAHANPQLSISPPSIAYDPFATTSEEKRFEQLLNLVRKTDKQAFKSLLLERMSDLNIAVIGDMGPRWYNLLEDADSQQAFIAAVRQAHGDEFADALPPAALRQAADEHGARIRHKITNPDLRFFVAVLINAPDRNFLVQLLAERFGQSSPNQLIFKCVFELFQAGLLKHQIKSNGIEDIVEHCLTCDSTTQVLEKLAQEYEAQDVAAVEPMVVQTYHHLRNLPLLDVLWR